MPDTDTVRAFWAPLIGKRIRITDTTITFNGPKHPSKKFVLCECRVIGIVDIKVVPMFIPISFLVLSRISSPYAKRLTRHRRMTLPTDSILSFEVLDA